MQHGSQNAPSEGSIETGEVVRIEAYGAFVQLANFHRMRGLLHISQISDQRLEQVQDALALGDTVWVKVLEVNTDEAHVDPSRPPRLKIKLTMKGIAQDGTAREQEQANQANAQMSQSIEQSLNSTIGMGVARDPMAHGGSSNLILKNDPSRKPALINGYALVDDTEGEPPPPVEAPVNPQPVVAQPARPALGRGRGTTLPAWMTSSSKEGPLKKSDESVDSRRRRHRRKGADDDKKHKKKKKSKHKHRDRSSERHSRRKRHRKGDDDSYSSRSQNGDRDRHSKKKRKHRRSIRDRSVSAQSDDADYSRRRNNGNRSKGRTSRKYSGSSSDGSDVRIQSVEEAKRIVQELERKQR